MASSEEQFDQMYRTYQYYLRVCQQMHADTLILFKESIEVTKKITIEIDTTVVSTEIA